ncbi:MAG: hypothetical protein RBS16_02340 [Candidatus Cloacimonadales bacterium]|jgi:hypothetical protein|nr:hypothetical protein [Candidatus Cloacimonadota bacterium]MDD2650491.1 hypothetical protein [Candidatus Cloacimonadota bacterium]MDD3501037.1 hypothetical protein [Candidatus Cloacimonadota bacterium]MDX9976850.1 hypothetical protein [Candidatus Cloacimonadales bacterium]
MHLRVFKENEKKGLIDLAFYLFNLDGEFDEHEQNYISIFSHATMMNFSTYEPQKQSLQQIYLQFKDSSVIVKEAVFYELVFLTYRNHIPTDKEKKFIDNLKAEWNISDEKLKKTLLDLKRMQTAQKHNAVSAEH